MNLAGSKFNGSDAEYFGTLGVVVVIVLTAIGVFLFVKSRQEKTRRTRIQHLVRQLDGRPLVYVPYANCQLAVPDVLSSAQAHGYALMPNPMALRYEFALGAPQTAFTGNPARRTSRRCSMAGPATSCAFSSSPCRSSS